MAPPSVRVNLARPTILLLGRKDVIEGARDMLRARVAARLPEARLSFASDLSEVDAAADFQILVAPPLAWLPDAASRLTDLRWIHLLSAGADRIFEMSFPRADLLLSKSSGVHAVAMSEFAIGAMLFFAKRLGLFVRQQQRCEWQRFWLPEIAGRTLAILGLGSIGRALAIRARTFDMRVIGTNACGRPVPEVEACFPADRTRAVLADSDYVVVTLPLTPATRGLLDRDAFRVMRRSACLINLARGGVVVEADLVAALEAGEIAGAALDVFETEPLPAASPLWAMDNVLVTPHVAGTSDRYMKRAIDLFLVNLESLRSSGVLATPIDRDAGY
jgi:phosphoglycerate dehydrogenase-like enzyme